MNVEVWTDGSCYPTDVGAGGAAAIIVAGDRELVVVRSVFAPTTNNRMELCAVCIALAELRGRHAVHVWTDSEYVSKGWERLPAWKLRDWRLSGGKPVKNVDWWQLLERLASPHRVTFGHVKGHAGEERNERCDRLALAARRLAEANQPPGTCARCGETLMGEHVCPPYDAWLAGQGIPPDGYDIPLPAV